MYIETNFIFCPFLWIIKNRNAAVEVPIRRVVPIEVQHVDVINCIAIHCRFIVVRAIITLRRFCFNCYVCAGITTFGTAEMVI